MVFRALPPEIQFRILEFCSPSDLAVLSRTHSSGRDMAEYALYSRIQYCARPSDMIINVEIDEGSHWELKEDRSLLHTFANNLRKASIVKMFYVELVDEFYDDDIRLDAMTYSRHKHFILVKLAEALEKMFNLEDLRILHFSTDDDRVFKGIRRLSEAIRFVFRGGVDDD